MRFIFLVYISQTKHVRWWEITENILEISNFPFKFTVIERFWWDLKRKFKNSRKFLSRRKYFGEICEKYEREI
jgi:hypothetical protein